MVSHLSLPSAYVSPSKMNVTAPFLLVPNEGKLQQDEPKLSPTVQDFLHFEKRFHISLHDLTYDHHTICAGVDLHAFASFGP